MVNSLELRVVTKSQQESLQAILDSGALNVENGDVTLHFQGNLIQSIEIRVKAYQRKKAILDFTKGSAILYSKV